MFSVGLVVDAAGMVSPSTIWNVPSRDYTAYDRRMRSLDLAINRINAATAEVAGASRRISTEVTTAATAFSASAATAVAALSRTTLMICVAMVAVAIVAVAALMKAST
jgi:hypothetical protein